MFWDALHLLPALGEVTGARESLSLQYTDRFTSGVEPCSVVLNAGTPIGLLGVDMTKRSPADA
jgi:hypothetical protein